MSDNEIENLSRFPNPNSVDDDIDDDYNNKKRSKYWEKAKLEVIDKQNNEYNENTTNKQTANSKWDTLVHLISATPSNAKSFLGVEKNKSLINWEERTFKVLRSNRLFGGEIKDSAIGEYLNHVKDNNYSDPFSMYNKVGKAEKPTKQNESVLNIAYKQAKKKLFTKSEQTRNLTNRSIEREFEQTEPAAAPVEDIDNVEGPIDACCPKSPFRRLGVNFCDRLFDNYIDKTPYDQLLKEVKQHRPYFTYWITFVQIVVCIVSLIAYGISPVGFSFTTVKGLATTINLEKQFISYPVKQNFWIGPAVAGLIHLGAKYAPCMRNDSNIYEAIQIDRSIERQSACCIRNDRGGCVQTSKEECSNLFSRWNKWNKTKNEFGSVCGLDPEYCMDTSAKTWPVDITQWPICENPKPAVRSPENEHMYCEIIGRPCCVGVQGECIITTREHCDLRKGYFHDNAYLCSQVDCMQGICGMIEFLKNKSPDQVYRLFTSIFIHAGIVQLLITILFQVFLLRDVEKLAGCVRVSIIYLGSGVLGNLASAIFLPYQAEVGPSGCQFGTLGCIFIEMWHARKIYKSPCAAFLKMIIVMLILFSLGFLPMIDNYANIFGFISGLLLSTIVFPNVDLNGKCKRIIIIIISTVLFVGLTATLVVFFYIKPIDKCDWCKFLSCPFSSNFCLNMDFNITRIRN